MVICQILALVQPFVPLVYFYILAGLVVAVILISRIRHFTPYVFTLLSWTFGIVSLWILIRYSIQLAPLAVVGNDFVNKEIIFGPGIYLKPATLFMFTAFLYFAFSLESPIWKQRFRNMAPELRKIMLIGAFLVTITAIFEFIYNAIWWASQIFMGQSPDQVVNPYPQVLGFSMQINVAFALKIITLILGCSVYTISYLWRFDKSEKPEGSG